MGRAACERTGQERKREVMATIIRVNGDRQVVTDISLDSLQEIVGGYIEVLRLRAPDGWGIIINEEGKLQDLPVNEVATEFASHLLLPNDCIVGDAVLLDPKEMEKL